MTSRKTTDLNWVRLSTGNRAAIGSDRFYVVGHLDRGWFLEDWADPDTGSTKPADVQGSYGFRRMSDAMAEAIEREEVAELLAGKYGFSVDGAHRLMAEARKHGKTHYCNLTLAVDAGGYTISEDETR